MLEEWDGSTHICSLMCTVSIHTCTQTQIQYIRVDKLKAYEGGALPSFTSQDYCLNKMRSWLPKLFIHFIMLCQSSGLVLLPLSCSSESMGSGAVSLD